MSESKIIYISTNHREEVEFEKGKFTVKLSENIRGYRRVSLNKIHFPNGMDIIRTGYNDKLYWRDATTAATLTATITQGNYTITSLITEINTQLAATKTDANTYTIALASAHTSKLVFTATAGTIALYTGDNSILPILGFGNSIVAAALSLTSTYYYNLTYMPIFITHNIPADHIVSAKDDLHGFQISLGKFGEITTNLTSNLDEYYTISESASFNSIVFRLVDENGDSINNNGIAFSFTLKFD